MSDMYRDPEPGAVARRRDLLGRRRDELVTMPHAVRRVVVARWARIVASIAAWLGAEAMVIAAVSPSVADWVTRALPGREPAPLLTLLAVAWALALLGYFVARSAVEHRFAVAMSRTVLPGDDVYHDLQRLDHVHPDEVARSMAHRLEVLSAALPVAAAATILPATTAYVAMGVQIGGWPSERAYEGWVVDHASALAWIAMLGLAASVAVTRRAVRLPIAAPIAALLAAASAGLAAVSWWFVGPAVIAATLAVIVRRLRIERGRIHAEDPAAGSEVFTLRGMIRRLRAGFATCRAFVRWHRRVFVFAVATVASAVIAIVTIAASALRSEDSTVAPTAAPAVVASVPLELGKVTQAPGVDSHSTYWIDRAPCERMPSPRGGCMRLGIVFRDHEALDIPSVFPGLTAIPAGWRAQLGMRFEGASSSARGVTMIAFPVGPTEFDQNPRWLDDYHSSSTVDVAACGNRVIPASLRVKPDSNGPSEQRVMLLLDPTLELASTCSP